MKNITLTVSAARTGTRMLCKLLSEVPDMHADHEEVPKSQPSFCYLRESNIRDPNVGRNFIENEFLKYVDSLSAKYYVCTAQSVSKGYIEHFLDLGVKPNFIIIRRDPRLIAKSLWQLDWIPGKHPLHRIWYPGPQESNVLPVDDWKSLHPYQLCYWYVADCERRAQHYEKLLPSLGLRVWHTTTDHIPNIDKFNNMLDYFGLPNVSILPQKRFNTLRSLKTLVGKANPPEEFFYKLEVELLERIPLEWKSNLIERGWGSL
jgi:hypothetical protein